MSYRTWHEYGYGIIVDKIPRDDLTVDKILNLVHHAPIFEKDFLEWVNGCYGSEDTNALENISVNNLLEYENDCGYIGLGTILQGIIEEVEGIYFTVCEDFDCVQYLMYAPNYPWYMGEKEKSLKEEDIATIIEKYVSMLTDSKVSVCYLECENGG